MVLWAVIIFGYRLRLFRDPLLIDSVLVPVGVYIIWSIVLSLSYRLVLLLVNYLHSLGLILILILIDVLGKWRGCILVVVVVVGVFLFLIRLWKLLVGLVVLLIICIVPLIFKLVLSNIIHIRVRLVNDFILDVVWSMDVLYPYNSVLVIHFIELLSFPLLILRLRHILKLLRCLQLL